MTTTAYEYGPAILTAEGVSFSIDGHSILRGLDLEIRDLRCPGRVVGQVVAILGPSGVGKTRLIRILAGLDAPSAGRVRVGATAAPVARGSVGVVAQDFPLFAHRTALDNLVVAALRTGGPRKQARERASGFLARFGLEACGQLYPAQLSGGQRQRVAIAQQFLCSEHFLLMDEPFSGLDPVALDSVCALIREVSGLHELNTILVATHDIAAAIAVADMLVLLGCDRDRDGRCIPGARIKARYDLVALGLKQDAGQVTPATLALEREVRARFHSL